MIESRKSEIRYRTDGPKKMLGKWLSKSVTKSWTETFKDEDTGKDVPVERTEVLFERGTYIDNDKLQQIMFFQSEGSIKDVEVSNQNRRCVQLESTALYPYIAKVIINDKKKKLLLKASSIKNVLDIISDYIELNFDGQFVVEAVQEQSSCIILIDNFEKVNMDEQYLKDNIDTETYMEHVDKENEKKKDDQSTVDERKFYDFDTSIFVDDVKSGAQKFIVYTNSVDKGLMIINAYLATKEKQRVQRMQEQYEKHQSEIEPADDLERKVIAAIEQVKPIPISRYIPLEFSMVYNEEK
jgi:hypothetical protein